MSGENYSTRQLSDEYEIQHFGFSSTIFISEFEKAINFTFETTHKELEECIARKLDLDEEKKAILRVEMQTLTDAYAEKTKECLAKQESAIRNFFYIPKNILLNSDIINKETEDVKEEELLNEIKNMEREYIKEKSLAVLYENEINHINRTSELQQQISKLLKKIGKIPKLSNSKKQFNKLLNMYQSFIKNSNFNTELF